MADVVSPEVRSKMMSGIKGKNTKPEIILRKALFRKGFRYRLHDKKLPGKPDLVFPKYKAVIFVHGCFWHLHDCHLFKWPKTRPEFWKEKISQNRERDKIHLRQLIELNWRILIVWECAFKGKKRIPTKTIISHKENWFKGSDLFLEFSGKMKNDL